MRTVSAISVLLFTVVGAGGCASAIGTGASDVLQAPATIIDPATRAVDRGTRLRREGRLEEAELYFRRALATDATARVAQEGLALIHLQRGNDSLASLMLERVNATQPKRLETLNGLGAIADRSERYGDAQALYLEALELDPDSARTMSNLGYSYYLEGRLSDAQATLEKAVAIDPQHDLARSNLALVRVLLGDQEGASSALSASGPRHQALNNLGYLNLLVDDAETARASLRAAIDAAPGYYGAANGNLSRLDDPGNRRALEQDRSALSLPETLVVERPQELTAERRPEFESILIGRPAARSTAPDDSGGESVRSSRTTVIVAPVSVASLSGSDLPAADRPDEEPADSRADDFEVTPAVIREVQIALAQRGFAVGEPDGKAGKATTQAIRLFKIARQIPVDDDITAGLLRELGVTSD